MSLDDGIRETENLRMNECIIRSRRCQRIPFVGLCSLNRQYGLMMKGSNVQRLTHVFLIFKR